MYRDLINAGALSNKELTENYISAATLKPGRSEAYFLLIDLYKNAGMDEASLSKITELYEGYSKAAYIKGRDFKDLSHEVAMDVFIYKNGSPYERLKDAECYLNASGLESDKSFLAIKSFYEAENLTKSDKESFMNLSKALMANADLMIGKDSGLYKAKLYELIIDFASSHSGLEEVKALAESKLQGGAL